MKTAKKTFTSKHLGNYIIELRDITKKKFKGDIIITDPHYYLSREIWLNFDDILFDVNKRKNFSNHGLAIITVKGKKCRFLYTKTAYGDIYYPFTFNSGILKGSSKVGVCTEMISVALLKDAQHLYRYKYKYYNTDKLEDIDHYPKLLDFEGIVKIDGCNFTGDINVITDYEDDYE